MLLSKRNPTECSRPLGWLGRWRPVLWGAALLWACSLAGKGTISWSTSLAQDETLEDVATEKRPAPPAAAKKAASGQEPSLFDMFLASGTIGIIITILSLIAVGFIVEHALTIRRVKLIPDDVLQDLGQFIGQGQIDQAIEYCNAPENDSLVTDVVLAGLERYKSSEFGFAEYKNAVEEAGEDCTSRLYRKTEVLSVIGAIAPMLGLLGTVQGMILAFNTLAAAGGMARPDQLAGSISLALVTTFEGLIVAIPAMVAFSFFRNRIDSLVAEAGKRVEHIMLPLGRRKWA